MKDCYLIKIIEAAEKAEEIAANLPKDKSIALSCISIIIDAWSANNDISSWETWQILYDTARQVHETEGDFHRDEET